MSETKLPPFLLLDLDDTLLSFSAGPRDFWREAIEARAHLLPPSVGVDRLLSAIEGSANRYWAHPVRAHRGRLDLVAARRRVSLNAFARLGLSAPQLATELADHYTSEKEAAVTPFEGIVEVLEALCMRGVRMALVTNGSGPFQRNKLARYDLGRFFEHVCVEGELGFGKPDPRTFERALQGLSARPEQTWMVGDNLEADIAGAQALGVRGVWNDHAQAGLPPGNSVAPFRVINHLRELL